MQHGAEKRPVRVAAPVVFQGTANVRGILTVATIAELYKFKTFGTVI
jgi:hypothetical protein